MICELVRRGKTVGITANSHKVIRQAHRLQLVDPLTENYCASPHPPALILTIRR
jgi:hypothetical protein